MMGKIIYALHSKTTGKIVNQTHLMLLKNNVEAAYMFINFCSMMNRNDLELYGYGVYNDLGFVVTADKPVFHCDLSNFIDYVNSLDDDCFEACNLDKNIMYNAFNSFVDKFKAFCDKTEDNAAYIDSLNNPKE